VTLFIWIWHEMALGGGVLEAIDAVTDASLQHSRGRRPLGCKDVLVGIWSMTTTMSHSGAGYTDLGSLDPLFYSSPVVSDLVPSMCEQECVVLLACLALRVDHRR
jgi:hypothetical protein